MAKILIVEDDALISKIYLTRLKSEGHTVLLASDMLAAEETVKKEDFDLALVDIMIPKGDGLAVLELIKKKKKTIPVLVFSNVSDDEEIARAKSMGAEEFLVKANITPSQVVEKIIKYLPRQKLHI